MASRWVASRGRHLSPTERANGSVKANAANEGAAHRALIVGGCEWAGDCGWVIRVPADIGGSRRKVVDVVVDA